MHAAVGRGELPVKDVIRAVVPEAELAETKPPPRKRSRRERGQGEEGWFNLAKVIGLKFRWPGSGDARGQADAGAADPRRCKNDVPVTFEEGGAVPGDRIVGVLSGRRGHPHLPDPFAQAQGLRARALDRRHLGRRSRTTPSAFRPRSCVTALNEPGTLAQIAQVIGEADGNIDNVRMMRRAKDFTEMQIELEVWDLDHLTQIITGLKGKAVVSSVERIFE